MWEYCLLKFSILPGAVLLKKICVKKFNLVLCFGIKAACYAGN